MNKKISFLQRKFASIDKKIAALNATREELRQICHADGHQGWLTGKYRGNTGNYDPGCDSYWVEFSCPVCGKRWSEDQSEVFYHRETKSNRTKDGIFFTQVY